jgi:hypothetical protein
MEDERPDVLSADDEAWLAARTSVKRRRLEAVAPAVAELLAMKRTWREIVAFLRERRGIDMSLSSLHEWWRRHGERVVAQVARRRQGVAEGALDVVGAVSRQEAATATTAPSAAGRAPTHPLARPKQLPDPLLDAQKLAESKIGGTGLNFKSKGGATS